MENFDQRIDRRMEPAESDKTKTKIDLDEIALEYADKLREELLAIKNKEKEPRDYQGNPSDNEPDSHFSKINISDLTHDDLIIFDKFKKNTLTEVDFKNYQDKINEHIKFQRNMKEKNFVPFSDSRENFSAYILNQMIDKRIKENLFNKNRDERV